MREPSANDFQCQVEGIGNFRFAKRTLRDDLRIQAEYSTIAGHVDSPTRELAVFASCYAALKVLLVQAPDGWDLDSLDPLDDDAYTQLVKVHNALRSQEDRFRQGKRPRGEVRGEGAGSDAGLLVSQEVRPGAN